MAQMHAPVLLSLLLSAALPAAAADACRPMKLLPAGTHVKFSAQDVDLLPTLRVNAASSVVVAGSPAEFGLDNATRVRTVADGLVLRQRKLDARFLGSEHALLQFQQIAAGAAQRLEAQPSGSTSIEADGRRYLIRVVGGGAVDSHGNGLKLMPLLGEKTTFSVDGGATVRLTDASHVQFDSGARFAWSPALAADGLEAELRSPAYLRQQAPASFAAQVEIVRSRRVFPDGALQVKVTARGHDFGKDPLTFCFEDPDAASAAKLGAGASPSARLVDRSTDSATYEVVLPRQVEDRLQPRAASLLPAFHRPAQVRVLGYQGTDLAFEATQPFQLANARTIVLASVLAVAIAFVLGGAMSREAHPARMVQQLLRRADGAYSLSNLQVLLWTLLVVFAFCYVWAGSDRLVDLSPGILVLLGISGGASVLARKWDPNPPKDAGAMDQPHYADFVSGEDGRFDLLRFQMLAFTVFTWIYAASAVLRTQGFPDIPENLYLLMGISNAAYLGGKAMATPGRAADVAANGVGTGDTGAVAAPAAAPDLTEAEKTLAPARIEDLQRKLGVPVTGTLDDTTREAVVRLKQKKGIVPATPRVNELFLAAL